MSIHPNNMPTSREQRLWDSIGDLRREVRTMRRMQSNRPQHAYAENIAGSSGNVNTTPLVVCSVTVNIPTVNHRVLLSPSVSLHASNNASEITAAWTTDDPNFAGAALPFGAVLNSSVDTTVSPGAANWTAGQIEFWNQGFFIDAYNYPSSTSAAHVPTVGDRVFSLVTWRNAGVATYAVSNARLWVGVL